MDLLEYQAMPSLRDIAHDSVLCTFNNRSALDRDKWCGPWRAGGMDRPLRIKSHPAGSLFYRQAAVLGQPSRFGLIGPNTQKSSIFG